MGVPKPTTDPAVPTTPDGVRAILKRARAGDETTLPALRKMLADPSVVAPLGGNLAFQAEHSLITAMAGDDLSFRESVVRKLELLRAELAGPAPSPVERLLVERAAACWLQVQDADIRYAQNQAKLTLRQLDSYQRRMGAAHRRYLSALKALAAVRKLALPVLQVNIADKQVNVAGGPPAGR